MAFLANLFGQAPITPIDGVLPWYETVLRLSVALASGLVIGWERERRQRPAGLRTHALVALGSCAFMLVGLQLRAQMIEADRPLPGDALRVIGEIAGGIGFLGAGAIIQSKGEVRGLTTAAGMWVVAALGVAAAAAHYTIVITTCVAALVTLFVLLRIERHLFDHVTKADDAANPLSPNDDPPTSSTHGRVTESRHDS